jgi:hypothetical protein
VSGPVSFDLLGFSKLKGNDNCKTSEVRVEKRIRPTAATDIDLGKIAQKLEVYRIGRWHKWFMDAPAVTLSKYNS